MIAALGSSSPIAAVANSDPGVRPTNECYYTYKQLQAGHAVLDPFAQEVGPAIGRQRLQAPDLVAQGEITLFRERFQFRLSGYPL